MTSNFDFSDQTCPKKMFPLQNILHIRISVGTKFQLNFDFLDQIYPKRVFPIKNGKSEHHQWILHIQIILGTKFHFKESSLNFRTKFAQKVYFPSKKYAKITTDFSILKLVYNTWQTFWDQSPSPIITAVCKYLRQCLGTSFGVAALLIYCNIE